MYVRGYCCISPYSGTASTCSWNNHGREGNYFLRTTAASYQCVLHIKPFFLPVDTQRSFFILRRKRDTSSVVTKSAQSWTASTWYETDSSVHQYLLVKLFKTVRPCRPPPLTLWENVKCEIYYAQGGTGCVWPEGTPKMDECDVENFSALRGYKRENDRCPRRQMVATKKAKQDEKGSCTPGCASF